MEKALEESEVQLLFDKFDGVDSVLRHIGSYPYRCFFVARHMSRCTNLFLLHSSSVFVLYTYFVFSHSVRHWTLSAQSSLALWLGCVCGCIRNSVTLLIIPSSHA